MFGNLANGYDRLPERIFNRHQCVDCKIVCTPHPFAYFRFVFAEASGEIFLLQALRFQYIVDAVDNHKRYVDAAAYFAADMLAAFFDDATSFHLY